MTGPLEDGDDFADPFADPFADHRRLLFRIAYDVLGSVADAEDVVQETWLRWSATDRGDVRDPRAYLVRIATTQALNRLRSVRTRRETYVGPWLPEPLVDAEPAAEDVADRVVRDDEVSLAVLVVLESLAPAERAVFVLREVFGLSHDEIATVLDRTPAGVRQLAHRAREHVHARRPRFAVDRDAQRQVTERFLLACATGDVVGLLALLAPDVTLVSDGGGIVRAARRPIEGADKVSRFLLGIAEDAAGYEMRPVLVNGDAGLLLLRDGLPAGVASVDLDADGLVASVFYVGNPEKLGHLVAP